MCDQVSITSQLLEITKTLAEQNVSFNICLSISINNKDFLFQCLKLKEEPGSSSPSKEEEEISKSQEP